MAIAQRTDIVWYMECGTAESPDIQKMGFPWTKLTESPSAQTKSKKYVNETEERETISRYKPSYAFECDLDYTEPPVAKVYDIGTNRVTGSGAIVTVYIVDLFKGATGSAYPARKLNVAVNISSIDDDDDMKITGNFNGQGAAVKGMFNTTAPAFTADD